MIAINQNSIPMQKERIARQAILVRHKMATLVAFSTTMFFLCLENVKAFTAPIQSVAFNENTLLFLASGAHSMMKRWKNAPPVTNLGLSSRLPTASMAFSKPSSPAQGHSIPPRTHGGSSTSLKMAFGFGAPSTATAAPQMLDMKTSLNAFTGWYNSMDPVARPPVYDDEISDYSFSSPTDSWPSAYDDSISPVSSKAFASNSSKKDKRPRPIRTIRRFAGWVFGSAPARNARGFGTQTFL
jgi:hypothetical protein